METADFITQVANGNATDAKDLLNDLLTARAYEALGLKKVEIAKMMYSEPQEQEVETEE